MILRVTIGNLYSFNEETEISFVAGKSTSHNEQVCRAEKRDDISVLKAGIIYGANASGKSNIIKAVSVLRQIAVLGLPKKAIEPFKLTAPNNAPSKIEMEFRVGDKFFAYGVEFSIKGLSAEWLYEINDRTDKEIYSRKVVTNGNESKYGTVKGNAETRQFIKFIAQSTPATQSFLSEYVKRNGRGLSVINEVYDWLKDHLKIIFPSSRYEGISIRLERDKDFALATKDLLNYFNTGIVDIRRIKVSKEELDLPSAMVDKLMAQAEPNQIKIVASLLESVLYFFETNKDGITTVYKQIAVHMTDTQTEILFEMSEESDGSIRLLDFIPMLIDLRLNDSVYLIDEIDRSMHPMLSQKLLEYYFHHLAEERKTQLIFTTHESNLLDLDVIRADEVWFVEKGRDGASHLTSLAEYKPREDIRKGYLQGRYGAIPFFAPIKSLRW